MVSPANWDFVFRTYWEIYHTNLSVMINTINQFIIERYHSSLEFQDDIVRVPDFMTQARISGWYC